MRIRFWGTRGSLAKPGPSTVRYGGNTSCVEVRSPGGTIIVLDCGTGAHALGHRLGSREREPRRGAMLITHTHWDHIQGFPFFVPLRAADNEWDIYGPRGAGLSLRDTLAGQMQDTYFPVTLDELGATVHYHDLLEGEFEVGDIRVTAQYLNHPALTLGYRLESDAGVVVYATDHEPHCRPRALGEPGVKGDEDEHHAEFLADADLVIHDSQYTAEEYPSKVGWGHSTIEYAVDTGLAAGVGHLALYHHDPLRDDASVDALLKLACDRAQAARGGMKVSAAAEGEVIELKVRSPRRTSTSAEPSAVARPTRPLNEQSVLVASHDSYTLETLGEAVRADDLTLFTTSNGNEALEIAGRERPSLVIVERGLEGCDGLEVCRAIRALEGAYASEVALVMVSEDDTCGATRLRESEDGVTDWLVKPLNLIYARTRVRAWLLRTACRWQRAPLPPDESRRVKALRRLGILDTEPEERFDRYTRIAAALFDVPIALVSLVDSDRQWFKSRHGIDVAETPRDQAFCAHAILEDRILQVPDALEDSRFADNPLVTGDLRVRFYAGVPITLEDGSRAGTLCLIDHRPRQLDAQEEHLLSDLGKLVEHELRTSGRKSPKR